MLEYIDVVWMTVDEARAYDGYHPVWDVVRQAMPELTEEQAAKVVSLCFAVHWAKEISDHDAD
jgi:hypothetical protein